VKTQFICLANARKHGERCIAGIEVLPMVGGGHQIVRDEAGRPRWIRPVSDREHGQVPTGLVTDIRLFDLVELDTHPGQLPAMDYQRENVRFDPASLCVLKYLPLEAKHLDLLTDQTQALLFDTPGNCIPAALIGQVARSLTLVRVRKARVYESERRALRIRFLFGESFYDLPITDVWFFRRFDLDNTLLARPGEAFLTVSLGVEHEGKIYKLAAGVFPILS
jgi:hypothetical protein